MREVDADMHVRSAGDRAVRLGDAALMEPFLHKPGFLLARIDQISTSIFSGASHGTTLRQTEFLMMLEALGPVPQIRLANAAGIDKSTTAYVLANLQNRGLVERSPCAADRRRFNVSLTPAGRSLLQEIKPRYAGLQRKLVAPIDPAKVDVLLGMLHKLGSNAQCLGPIWTPACDPAAGMLDKALSFLTRRALQLFQAQFAACTEQLDLTLRQFSLLFLLSRRDSLTQAAFARIFGLDPSTCAVIMRSLAAGGLIASARSAEDQRERMFRITGGGRQALGKVQPLADHSEATVLRGLCHAEQVFLIHGLRTIVKKYSPILRFPGAIDTL